MTSQSDILRKIRRFKEKLQQEHTQGITVKKRSGATNSFILGNPGAESYLGSAVLGDDERTSYSTVVSG